MLSCTHENEERLRRDIVDLSVLPTCGKPRGPEFSAQSRRFHHVGIFSSFHRVTHRKSSERPLCEGAGIEDHHLSQSAVACRARQAAYSPREKASVGFGKPPHEVCESDAIPGSVGAWRNAGNGYSNTGGYCSAQALTIEEARATESESPHKQGALHRA